MDFVAIVLFFIALAFISLFFDLWSYRPMIRLLIWAANVLLFSWLSNLFAGIAELQTNANEGNSFLAALRPVMGISAPQAVFKSLPEASTLLPGFLRGLVVVGVAWALLIAIVLVFREQMRFTRTMLFCCVLFNVICQTAYLQIKRHSDGARITTRYFQECKSEIERINALSLDETTRRDFYQKTIEDFRWTYEKASRNYDSMERLLEELKAFPPNSSDNQKK